MAKKQVFHIIDINEKDVNLKDTIKGVASAPFSDLVVTSIVLDDQIEKLKTANEKIKDVINKSKYDDVIDKMVKEGVLDSHQERPLIAIETMFGTKISVTLLKGIDDGFEIDKAVSEKSIFDTVVPDKYKKVIQSLDKKQIEEDFDNNTLPSVLKGYCSKNPTEILKIYKKTEKVKSASKQVSPSETVEKEENEEGEAA